MGTITIYPAYRSFPEVFTNNPNHLYIPWSQEDALAKIDKAFLTIGYHEYGNNDKVYDNYYQLGKISDWQDGTIDREIDIWQGNGEQWARNGLDYRTHLAKDKYK